MRVGRGRSLLIIKLLLLIATSQAQQIVVKGGFLEDSLVIGQNVAYWMSAIYPPNMEMVLPDSNYSFTPFEFGDKTYFPTQLRDGLAFDSTVYLLQSFEIDPVQYLQLNAVILNSKDSVIIASPLDSVYLKELAPIVTDTTKLKKNLDYQAVNRQFNYPLMYYIIGGLILLTSILLLIFGKRIIRFFRLRRMEKVYKAFSQQLTALIHSLKKDPNPQLSEKALILWKTYQEKLEKIPFSSLTTKEIISIGFAHELEKPLKSIDRVVYGNKIQETIYQDFQMLEDFTDARFKKKIEEIRNGK